MPARTSKFLSLVLRHQPELVGIVLDDAGWTDVATLLAACATKGVHITPAELIDLVAASDKQRFALSADGTRIRANQGHSVDVELGLPDSSPPARLYHGTFPGALASIRAEGLSKGKRHAVHMTANTTTAAKVGMRRGAPVLLVIRADEMAAAGHAFQVSTNGVWLTAHVPPELIDFPLDAKEDRDSKKSRTSPSRRAEAARHHAGGGDRKAIARSTVVAVDEGGYRNRAGEHVELAALIDVARAGTTLHELGDSLHAPPRDHTPRISVTAETTNEALRRLADSSAAGGHLACLNFASAKNPGGGFLGGARAQEESLARASALVTCLEAQPDYYARNRANRSPLYLDLVLFSPHVPFFRDDDGGWLDQPVLASVITAPAPNASAMRQQNIFDADAIEDALRARADFVLAVAAHHGVERLVLGAWGAGVFGNDPVLVADAFARPLRTTYASAFTEIVFAVLGGPGAPNRDAFVRAFGR